MKSMYILPVLRPPESSNNYSSAAGAIICASQEQQSAMTNDENQYSLLLSEHKVNQTFSIEYIYLKKWPLNALFWKLLLLCYPINRVTDTLVPS